MKDIDTIVIKVMLRNMKGSESQKKKVKQLNPNLL